MTANLLIEDTFEEIDKIYQPGALLWMKMNRLDDWGKMIAVEQKINKTALGSDLKGLRDPLEEYRKLILAMVREFEAQQEKEGQRMFEFK